MFPILLLLSCVLVNVVTTQPAINLQICKTNDDVCVTNSVKAAFPLILEPNENINAKNMDPMFVELIEGNLSILKFNFMNTTVNGYKSCEIQTAKFLDKKEDVLRINFICPKFLMQGLYEINGQLVILHVEGNGDYILETNKYSLTVDLELKTITKDGKNYKSIKSFKAKGEPLEKITFDFKNLFNGQKDLADVVLKFANENWKEVAMEVQDPVFYRIIKEIVKNANKYLKTTPIEN